ncbi:RNA polymerase sigma factor [Streptomyces sp. NPDC001422]|uniref:RNA polymerase sigma factor n=1 Tax=Streptomyces sp. NPDC001422 TaxID=3364575 RepID=UPI00367BB2FB
MTEPELRPSGESVAEFYEALGPRLVARARRLLKRNNIPESRLTAEDVVQDALVVVLSKQGRRNEIRQLDRYLYGIITNRINDEVRRLGVSDPIDPTASHVGKQKVLWVSEVEDADDVTDRLDAHRVLKEMAPQQRRLILLAKGVGYSHAELAELTGLHRGTVARHISRATQTLTSALGSAIAALAAIFVSSAISGRGVDQWLPSSAPSGSWSWWWAWGEPVARLLTLIFMVFVTRWAVVSARRVKLRRAHVLQAMVDGQAAVVEAAASDSEPSRPPGLNHYAQVLGLPERWVNRGAVYFGRYSFADGQDPREKLRLPLVMRRWRWIPSRARDVYVETVRVNRFGMNALTFMNRGFFDPTF